MKFKTNLKLKSGIIDPVPLLDIVLQIILFFVLATQFIGRPGLMLQLPKVGMTALYKQSAVKIMVTNEKLIFQKREITIDQLKQKLGEGSISMLVIEADKSVPHTKIVKIIDLATQMGVSEIAIATEEEK